MIRISTKRLRPGMRTAQSIYNRNGASYLTRNVEITEQYIDQLKKIGVDHVCVTSYDPNVKVPPQQDILDEKTREEAVQRVYDAYTTIEKGGKLDINPIANVSENIVMDLLASRDNLVQMTDLRLYDDYTFAHSVNVAALSSLLGILNHLSQNELMSLTMGALLHDIGKIDVPLKVLNKPTSLNDREFDIIKNHPTSGYNRLMELNLKDVDPRPIAEIAIQHHEHLDGSGYPNHLKGGQIHRLPRMVAIADVYDALTSARPYKRAYSPHVAYKIMTRCSGMQFDKTLLDQFFDHVALYPVGTVLRTNWGLAIVKKVNVGMTRFPEVLVFTNTKQEPLVKPVPVDTAEVEQDFIQGALEDQELMTVMYRMKMDPATLIADAEMMV